MLLIEASDEFKVMVVNERDWFKKKAPNAVIYV